MRMLPHLAFICLQQACSAAVICEAGIAHTIAGASNDNRTKSVAPILPTACIQYPAYADFLENTTRVVTPTGAKRESIDPAICLENLNLTLESTPECILEVHGKERNSNWASVRRNRLER
jgi:hypothetical protein